MSADNPLAGLPLKYLIGTDFPGIGKDGEIVESSYDVTNPRPHGYSIAYCNLFDEKNSGKYGPYLHTSDTAKDYGEGQPDPNGPGFEKNLTDQLTRRKSQGFGYVELDNPDAYSLNAVLRAVNIAVLHDLKVIAKNVGLGCNGDPADTIVSHTNVYGIIVEKGAGSASSMEAMRRKAQRPLLPVGFVFFGNGYSRGKAIANEIKAKKFANMGCTFSNRGEYGNALDLCVPNVFK
jgi:hypothetical protein